MNEPRRATRLKDVAAVIDQRPLPPGDPFYFDIAAGRGSDHLKRLRFRLLEFAEAEGRFAKILVTGHRGCGKSTELLRLEHEVKHKFTSLHLYAEESLLSDYQYPDLFLWIAGGLVEKFEAEGLKMNPGLMDDIARWFEDVSREDVRDIKKEIGVEAGVSVEGRLATPWSAVKAFAKLKSKFIGSESSRTVIRNKLKKELDDLIGRLNTLLGEAAATLKRNNRPDDLLIVVDDLDRLAPEAAQKFFLDAELLNKPQAHMIYTVPIATNLPPDATPANFGPPLTIPMIKVRARKRPGKKLIQEGAMSRSKRGIDALVGLVGQRIDIDAVFTSRGAVELLAEMSGGKIRDLMRLLSEAELSARVDEKERIDLEDAKRACKELRLDFKRRLSLVQLYFPMLAMIHRTKGKRLVPVGEVEHWDDAKLQRRFNQFLAGGYVLEYNGDDIWYDVHPIIQEIPEFKEALADAEAQEAGPAAKTE